MMKISSLLLAFMLFASLGFAWVGGTPPFTVYTVNGVNFTYSTSGQSLSVVASNREMYNWDVAGGNITQNTNNFSVTSAVAISIQNFPLPVSGNHVGSITHQAAGTIINISCNKTGGWVAIDTAPNAGTVRLEFNTSDNITYNISTKPIATAQQSFLCNNTDGLNAVSSAGTADTLTIPYYNATFNREVITPQTALNTSDYMGVSGTIILRSDFTTNKKTNLSSTSTYCQSLLYFNNPYYGNIQLIPKITYLPGIDAFGDFINITSNAAYLPNNTITYVYDSITSAWYIVPATICSSYSIVGSTTTLQYNPTATGNIGGGTVPISVNINGSCSYTTATRTINCTGSDASATVTQLKLSAYRIGNTTDLCNVSASGSSGTLACVLPATNGTYNAYFYGTDVNLLTYSFSYETITIGSSTTIFGRDGYLGVIILVGVAAMLVSSSIAVSMALACLGMFIGLAFGLIPADGNWLVAILFGIMAFAIAYRLKV